MALAAAIMFGLLIGFIAIRHRAMARWNTVAGLAVPVLFLVRDEQSRCTLFDALETLLDNVLGA